MTGDDLRRTVFALGVSCRTCANGEYYGPLGAVLNGEVFEVAPGVVSCSRPVCPPDLDEGHTLADPDAFCSNWEPREADG